MHVGNVSWEFINRDITFFSSYKEREREREREREEREREERESKSVGIVSFIFKSLLLIHLLPVTAIHKGREREKRKPAMKWHKLTYTVHTQQILLHYSLKY